MKILFEDKDLEELIETGYNHRYRKYARDPIFMEKLKQAYKFMKSSDKASDLSYYSVLKYEKLKHQYRGKSCIRVMNGRVERIIFKEIDRGIIINILELDDTHYGNKK